MTFQNVVQMFYDSCARFNSHEAVMVKQDGAYTSISHNFFKQRVSQFGRGLMALGFKPREHFAIMAETRFEWAIADLGILGAAGVSVPIYHTQSAEQVEYILHDSESVGVIVSDTDQLNKILKIQSELPQLKHIVVMDSLDDIPEGVHAMKDLEVLGADTDNEDTYFARWRDVQRDQLMTLIYTSGTTGSPKGVMLSHDNILSNIEGVLDSVPFGEHDICLSHLPLSHVLERMAGLYLMLYTGVTIAYAEDIKKMAENLPEVRPTVMISVPRLFEKIYAGIRVKAQTSGFLTKQLFNWALGIAQSATPYIVDNRPLPAGLGFKYNLADKLVFSKIREKTGGRLRFLISGGAPLPKAIGEFFLGIGIRILEGYGLTETSPVLTVNKPEKIKPGTVGPPISNVEIEIAEDGEIMARGPNVMMGYYNNPKATAETIVDGWILTGDVGVLDNDGYLRITDRKKEIIVTSGGKNIAPQPIENALKMSPLIENAVVIGEQRKFISALIVPPWETIDQWAAQHGWPSEVESVVNLPEFRDLIAEQIEFHMRDFAHYEKIKKFEIIPHIFAEDSGELTPSLKIKRKVISQKYQLIIDGMYDD